MEEKIKNEKALEVVSNLSEEGFVDESQNFTFETIENLNGIVKIAVHEEVKSRYGSRHPYYVTFFNDEKIEFVDSDNIYSLIQSYKKIGAKGFIKTKMLVKEVKVSAEGVKGEPYICLKYEFSDGSLFRLFPRNRTASTVIDNYHKQFKALHASAK